MEDNMSEMDFKETAPTLVFGEVEEVMTGISRSSRKKISLELISTLSLVRKRRVCISRCS